MLQDKFKKNGKTYRKTEYIADFEIINLDGSIEVIDVKGVVTPVFLLKRKLFERLYMCRLTVLVHKVKYGGFIELDEYYRLKRKEKKVNR